MLNKGKILVTGGSGFIGTNLIENLLEKGYEVLNIDIARPKIKIRERMWKKVDIRDFNELIKEVLLFDPEYIIHLAARTDLNGNDIDAYSSNTVGTLNVLKCSEQLHNLKKIIVTSSMLVCKTGYSPQNQYDYKPSTLYGESKVITEEIVWKNEPKCDWAIIRPTSIWGPWFDVPYRNFFDLVINRRYFHIGNRSCTKTYGYVGNAIYQIERILFTPTIDRRNKVFYIGDYDPTNIEEWANEISNQLGYKIIKIPFFVIRFAALIGDFLKKMRIEFPLTSFRVKNMTTNNIVDLRNTKEIVSHLPYSRTTGIKKTLLWMKRK